MTSRLEPLAALYFAPLKLVGYFAVHYCSRSITKSIMKKLKENNFEVRKLRICMVLSIKELDAHIDKEKVESDPKSKTTNWTKQDKKAMAIIGLRVFRGNVDIAVCNLRKTNSSKPVVI